MPGFLYYLPGVQHAAAKTEAAARLPYLGWRRCIVNGCDNGPDGDRGVVVADPHRTPPERIGYYPDRQTWRKAPGGLYWLGFYTAEPPGPGDLAHVEQLAGHRVTLCDGNEWIAPIAREFKEVGGELRPARALPGVATINEQGEWVSGDVRPKYRELWRIASKFAAAFFQGQETEHGVEFDYPDAELLAESVECLAANYAIGPLEVSALGLLDDRLYKAQAILQAVVDFPTFLAWLKKKAAARDAGAESLAGSTSAVGPPAG